MDVEPVFVRAQDIVLVLLNILELIVKLVCDPFFPSIFISDDYLVYSCMQWRMRNWILFEPRTVYLYF